MLVKLRITVTANVVIFAIVVLATLEGLSDSQVKHNNTNRQKQESFGTGLSSLRCGLVEIEAITEYQQQQQHLRQKRRLSNSPRVSPSPKQQSASPSIRLRRAHESRPLASLHFLVDETENNDREDAVSRKRLFSNNNKRAYDDVAPAF